VFFQNYPYNQIAQWVFAAIQPEGKNEIIFSEFVHMVAFFVMLAQKELMKFLFHAVDTDNKQYLRYIATAHVVVHFIVNVLLPMCTWLMNNLVFFYVQGGSISPFNRRAR